VLLLKNRDATRDIDYFTFDPTAITEITTAEEACARAPLPDACINAEMRTRLNGGIYFRCESSRFLSCSLRDVVPQGCRRPIPHLVDIGGPGYLCVVARGHRGIKDFIEDRVK
jgi:hypothetical protein